MRTPEPTRRRAPSAAPAQRAGLNAAELRRVWPNVLEEVKRRRRFTFMLLSQHAQVLDVTDGVLHLGFSQSGPKDNFGSGGSQDVLADALIQVIGVELRIQAVMVSGEDGAVEPVQRLPRRAGGAHSPARAGARRRPSGSEPGAGGLHRRRGAGLGPQRGGAAEQRLRRRGHLGDISTSHAT